MLKCIVSAFHALKQNSVKLNSATTNCLLAYVASVTHGRAQAVRNKWHCSLCVYAAGVAGVILI